MMKKNNDEGFAIPEAIFAMVIIGAALLSLSLMLYTTLGIASRSREKMREVSLHLKIDELLRREFSSIVLPYWENDFQVTIEDKRIELPFYLGKKENTLAIKLEDGKFLITRTGKENIEIDEGFEIITANIITGKNKPLGIEFDYRFRGISASLVSAFASSSFNNLEAGMGL